MSWLSDLFGKKEKPQTYGGERPYRSLLEVPQTKAYVDELTKRMAGLGVGFDPSFVSSATAPYAAQRRAGLAEQELPLISAQASARGLGRSSIPINRAALSSQAAERDINEKVAQMMLANEQQKRAEINQAVQGVGQFGQAEASQHDTRAGFDANEWANIQQQRQARVSPLQSIISPVLQGLTGFGIGGFSPTASISGISGQTVNIGGKPISYADYLKIQSLL